MTETVKENLTKYVKAGIREGLRARGDDRIDYSFEDVADYLIANGVTVQDVPDTNVGNKWISVKDGLPKPFVSVLVHMPDEAPCPTVREGFITDDGIWHSALYDREPGEVTHWMLMPQPPKMDGE